MEPYLEPLKKLFEINRNDKYARSMKKYMKGQFDYFGINSPLRKEITRDFYRIHGLPEEDLVEQVVKDCWDQPEREFQYFAMELQAKFAKLAEICKIDLYEYLVMSKSWWDTVDYIASNLMGVHFLKFPDEVRPYTKKWMESQNIWLQRSALLFQLKYKEKTDLEILDTYIRFLHGSKEFFINKAIGWILRQYSKTDEAWVKHYIKENKKFLAPLSKREALKWLEKKGKL